MTYAFLDDKVHEHPKQVGIGGAASWYWAMGLTYCRRLERHRRKRGERLNFISKLAALTLFPDPQAAEHIAAIVRVGLWTEVEDGYLVHDYQAVYGAPKLQEEAPPPGPAVVSAGGRALTPAQLEARRRGGLARAATASREGGAYQQRHQQPAGDGTSNGPATGDGPTSNGASSATSNRPAAATSSGLDLCQISSGSADTNTGEDPEFTAAAEDLTGSQRPATGQQQHQQRPAAAFIEVPADLQLTSDQQRTLETCGVGAYAIPLLTARFVAKAQADDKRLTLAQWRKSLVTAVTGDWNDPRKRPPDPSKAPPAVAQGHGRGTRAGDVLSGQLERVARLQAEEDAAKAAGGT